MSHEMKNMEVAAEKVIETAPTLLANPVPPVFAGDSATSTFVDINTGAPNTVEKRASVTEEDGGKPDLESGDTPVKPVQDESKLLKGRKLALVFAGMLLSVFLIALDQTILAPALPVIASKFNSLEQIAWIASAYFLTQTALLLLYGQALTVFDRKWTFMFAIVVFEVGSLLCGVAPNVNALIAGRAIAGCGAAGIFVSVLSIIAEVTSLEARPKLLGLFGAVFAVSSVIGPLLGGVFTDHVTWRLCFLINLPIGAVTIVAILFILGPQPAPPLRPEVEEYTKAKFARYTRGKYIPASNTILFKLGVLDWVGATLMLGLITCLVLALQWGGVKYAWSSGPVIGTLVAFAVLAIIFGVYEWKFAGVTQLVPVHLFKNRTQVGACGVAFSIMFAFLMSTYFLPIYYEATRGVTASKAGINILPFMIGVTLAAGVSGGIVSYTGRYWHILVFGPMLLSIGAGLLYTIDSHTSNGKLIGFQIICAVGVGMVLQQAIIAVQADSPDPDEIPQRTALVTFAQLIGGTVGIAIANTIFAGKLASALAKYAPDAPAIVRTSVEAIKDQPLSMQPGIKEAYAEALSYVFIIGIPFGVLASIFGATCRNISIKGKKMEMGGA